MSETEANTPIIKQVTEQYAGQRLDAALASLFPDYSRSRLQGWIKQGLVLLDGQVVKPKTRLAGDELLQLNIQADEPEVSFVAQNIPLDIVFEDEDLIVVNKPAGLVVHPAAGHYDGTLVNALLYHDSALQQVPRAGIVHRLDKDTTGLMVVAKNIKAHKHLVDEIQQRLVKREYQAVVHGVVTAGGTVDAPIGRHGRDRVRMCVREDGKPAITHYRVIKRYREHTHLQLELDSGRTHQIRVHMQSIRHPIVGDPVYGGRQRIPSQADEAFIQHLRGFHRQALHAFRLSLDHPVTGEHMSWQAPLPEDMVELLAVMQHDLDQHHD